MSDRNYRCGERLFLLNAEAVPGDVRGGPPMWRVSIKEIIDDHLVTVTDVDTQRPVTTHDATETAAITRAAQ